VSQEEKKSKEKKPGTVTKGVARLLGYGLVVMFLMVWVFVLGVLTGKGDVIRLLQRFGLDKTEWATRLGAPQESKVVSNIPEQNTEETRKAVAESEKKPAVDGKVAQTATPVPSPLNKASDQVASKAPAEPAKKPGTIVHHEAKRSKELATQKPEHDNSLAGKLSFQNSLDTPARKQSNPAGKKEPSVRTATIATVPSHSPAETTPGAEKKKPAPAYQVKVASYRTAEEAEKAMADLKKKGFKVSLQQGKEKSGNAFIIKTGRLTTKTEAEKVTQKLKEAKMNGQIQELKQ
jgi:hypothetical protein